MSPGPSSTIVAALEGTWAEMRDHHPDIPDVMFVSGKGTKGTEVKLGHWCPDRWHEYGERDNRLAEVFISGECLAQGGRQVLTTLLHEAAHGVAYVRGIKDTSRGNRYHNGKFATLAEELGLVRPEVPSSVRGLSACTLPENAEHGYDSFPRLEAAILVCIGGALELGPEAEEPRKRVPAPKYGCGCEDRFIRMSAKVADEGVILCGICEEPFLEVVT